MELDWNPKEEEQTKFEVLLALFAASQQTSLLMMHLTSPYLAHRTAANTYADWQKTPYLIHDLRQIIQALQNGEHSPELAVRLFDPDSKIREFVEDLARTYE